MRTNAKAWVFYFILASFRNWFRAGLDLENGKIRDNKEAGILEPLMSKVKSLKFATEAAITILRIDDLIKLEKPVQRRNDDDDDM